MAGSLLASHHSRARERGVRPLVYWLTRAFFQPFAQVYWRMSRVGREHIPPSGPVIYCSNHRSFLDPFVIGTVARRPIYYIAKRELFANRFVGWYLNALGAFPVQRGSGDQDMFATARSILARGDSVLIFAEGTRKRPGALGRPKRGVGRLALETGAPVLPVAVIGTEAVRRGWRIRPHKVRIRVGPALSFPRVAQPSPQLAAAVTDRIWSCVMLQWEWLGGMAPLRRAAVIGAGPSGVAVARMLARSGLDVELGYRSAPPLPPGDVAVGPAARIEFGRHDLVVLADCAPATLAAIAARIPARAGVLVLAGAVPLPALAEWLPDSSLATLGGDLPQGPALLAAADAGFRGQIAAALRAGGASVATTAVLDRVEPVTIHTADPVPAG